MLVKRKKIIFQTEKFIITKYTYRVFIMNVKLMLLCHFVFLNL